MKKLLIVLAVLLVVAVVAINIFSRKAPEMLVRSIENALHKKLLIRSIDYHFPGIFELEGFEIKETKDFAGETSFYVDKIRLEVSPLSLSQKKLVIDAIQVENATVVIRKYHGKLNHAFSDAVKASEPAGPADQTTASLKRLPAELPLEIRRLTFSKSNFKFIDYDAQEGGFVIVLDEIDAVIDNIALPFSEEKTLYKVGARMPQGRDQKAAEIKLSGRTQFRTKDTDANFSVQGAYLPYFEPYYRQVTQASIANAYVDSRISVLLQHNDMKLDAGLEISELYFQAYESDNQLFGLRAEEILSFLKDRSGRLKFQIEAEWNIADRSVSAKDIIRKSIERSLKKTVIGNVGNILENTLQKLGDAGLDNKKESLEDKIKRIKDILKY